MTAETLLTRLEVVRRTGGRPVDRQEVPRMMIAGLRCPFVSWTTAVCCFIASPDAARTKS